MKKSFLILTASVSMFTSVGVLATPAPGTGGVSLDNLQSQGLNGTSAQFNGVDVSTVSGLNVYFEVLSAPYTGTLLPSLSSSLQPVGAFTGGATVFQASTSAGFLGTFNAGSGVSAFDATTGNAQFQVIAWTGATSASTFGGATIRGVSSVWFQGTGAAPTVTPPSVGSPAILQIPDAHINLAVVPEPSTIALGVLGGLGLLLRRRK